MATAGNQPSEQLSEEELQAYFAQLREAPVADLLAQAYTMLGAWAEAKLGRRDARPLIDAMSALVQAAGAGLPKDLFARMRDGISQLQLAQVQAEQQVASEPSAEPQPVKPQHANPQPKAAGDHPGAQASQQRLTDRLWIPGRDPKPPPRHS